MQSEGAIAVMPNETVDRTGTEIETETKTGSSWRVSQVYAMAAIFFVVGLAIGYLFRGSQSPATRPGAQASSQSATQASANPHASAPAAMGGQMPSLEQMKAMADTKAAPLIEKLKSDPANPDLLKQVGKMYEATHQFKDAAGYYEKALQVDPKDVSLRGELAACLYYGGDVDGAISQLQKALEYNPKDANSLFNLGMIRWQGKQDAKGALGAWAQLLKANPQLEPAKKAQVERLMAQVRQGSGAN